MQPARREFFRGIEGDICDGKTAPIGGVTGGNLHFAQGPNVVSDFHDVLDLKLLHQSAVFIVATDLHEGAELGVDPDIDDLIFAGAAFGFVDAEFITGLSADVFVALEFRIRPVEKAEGEVFVGEIGAGDGLGDFFGREVLGLAVDHLEEVIFFIGEAHVENPPRVVFVELELDIFPIQKQSNRAFFAVFREIAVERFTFVELG